MKSWKVILPVILSLAACGHGDDKPALQQQRDTLEKAKQVGALQEQQAEKQRQEAEKQAQ